MRRVILSGVLLFVLILTLSRTPEAQAASIVVTGSADGELTVLAGNGTCDLREAVEAANTDAIVDVCAAGAGADTITFSGAVMFIRLVVIPVPGFIPSGQLVVSSEIDIDGGNTVTISGDADSSGTPTTADTRIFSVPLGGTLRLDNITLERGRSPNGTRGGAIESLVGTVEVRNSTIRDSQANSFVFGGGAISVSDGTLVVEDSTFTGNSAVQGGAINTTQTDTTIRRSTFTGNNASRDGGAILTVSSDTLIEDSTIRGNDAGPGAGTPAGPVCDPEGTGNIDGGGGISNNSGGEEFILRDSVVAGNRAACIGGGIHTSSAATVIDSTIGGSAMADRNTANRHGGGVYGAITLQGTTVTNNVAGWDGGGVYLAARIVESTISNNRAEGNSPFTGRGGGLYFLFGGEVQRSTISGNFAADFGGGVYNASNGPAPTFTNTTISGNTATNGGGGWFQDVGNTAAAFLVNVTIANNAPDGVRNDSTNGISSVPGIIPASHPLDLRNVVITGATPSCVNTNGAPWAGVNNQSDDASCSSLPAPTEPAGSPPPGPGFVQSGATMLGALGNNGGPTATHLPGDGSSLVNAGHQATCNAITSGSDQRNFARTFGPSCDIGAVEVQTAPTVGTITGVVYEDMDGNGTNGSEPGLSGWTVQLWNSAGTSMITSTTTNSAGVYAFNSLAPGTYRVRQVGQSGWVQTGPEPVPPGEYTVTIVAGQVANGRDFGNFDLVEVRGTVYHDNDGNNGFYNPDLHSPLEGWTIELVNQETEEVLDTATSAADGTFAIDGLRHDITYRIRAVAPEPGWTFTQPSGTGVYNNTVVRSGDTDVMRDFGFVQVATVSGMKWEDLNGNGIHDGGEPGLEGWTIELVRFGSIIASTVTGADGTYTLENVRPFQEVTLREVLQPGWAQTFPAPPGAHIFTADQDEEITGLNFGNVKLASISGTKYEDLDADGQLDAGEPPVQGFFVRLWTDAGDGEFGDIVGTKITDASGNYRFDGLQAGDYIVQEAGPGGTAWVQTAPVPGPTTAGRHLVTVAAGEDAEDLDFLNTYPGGIHGFKYDDVNGNGVYDDGTDLPLSGVTFTLSGTDNRGTAVPAGTTATTGADGRFSFPNLYPSTAGGGPGGAGTGYTVTETVPTGFTATTGTTFSTDIASGDEAVAFAGQAGTIAANQPRQEVIAGEDLQFGNTVPGSIHGFKFSDENGNGVYDAGTDEPQPDVTFTLAGTDGLGNTVGPVTTTSGIDGRFTFLDLLPGEYTITETVPAGYAPTGDVARTFTIESRDALVAFAGQAGGGIAPRVEVLEGADLMWGNSLSVSLHGRKFEDLDGDGVFDDGEPFASGVTFTLTGTNGLGAAVNEMTTTGADGEFHFEDLVPGEYTVTETVPTGSAATTATVYGPVTLTAGEEHVAYTGQAGTVAPYTEVVASGLTFGNAILGSIHGLKFEDVDADGVYDPEIDAPLEGITFILTGTDGQGGVINTPAVTNEDGEFTFSGLLPSVAGQGDGTGYTVTETVPTGQVATTPVTYLTDLTSGQALVWEAGAAGLPGGDPRTEAVRGTDLVTGNTVLGSIHGFAFEDVNGNGSYDSGTDTPLADVAVSLTGTDNRGEAVDLDTTTGADGEFAFTGLYPSTAGGGPGGPGTGYTVDASLLTGFTATTTVQFVTDLTSGQEFVAFAGQAAIPADDLRDEVLTGAPLMFGSTVRGSIHGFVFRDVNINGAYDDGTDTPLADVTATLTGTDGLGNAVPAGTTAITDGDGELAFTSLMPGSYTVTVTVPDANAATTATSFTSDLDSRQELVAFSGQAAIPGGDPRVEVLTGAPLMFGMTIASSIHGLAFEDVDGDGLYNDAIDLPLTDVAFTLTGDDSLGNAVDLTTTTGADGEFHFDGLLASDSDGYTVTQTPLPDAVSTTGGLTFATVLPAATEQVALAGQAGLEPDDPRSEVVTPGLQFGNAILGSVHGFKFEDVDGDGLYNPAVDAPLADVTFTLTGTDGLGAGVDLSTTTGADGEFAFTGLMPSVDGAGDGTGYTITETLPGGFVNTTPLTLITDLRSGAELVWEDGAAGLEPGDPQTEVNIGPELMFGNTVPGEIHVFKFDDLDADGVFDSGADLPLEGVTFTLTGTDGKGNAVEESLTTDSDGRASFLDLQPGSYTVTETLPEESVSTTGTAFSTELSSRQVYVWEAGADGVIAAPQVEVVEEGLAFGNAVPGSIHGFAYEDVDGNGSYDSGTDVPHVGVVFSLTGTDGAGNVVALAATSGANGEFSFTGLLPSVDGEGDGTGYTLTETVPTGFLATTATERTFDLESGIELVWQAGAANLPAGSPREEEIIGDELMFGNEPLDSSIHGFAFLDDDGDGVYEEGTDTPLEGISFTLTGSDRYGNPVSLPATSGSDGRFDFTGLVASDAAGYLMTEEVPSNYAATTPDEVTLVLDPGVELVAFGGQAELPVDDPRTEVVIGAGLMFGLAEAANLGLTFSDTPDPVAVGGTLTYAVTVTNAGPAPAFDVVVEVTLPEGVTFVSSTAPGWSCTRSGNVVTCTIASLAAESAMAQTSPSTITIVVEAIVPPGVITAEAEMRASNPDPARANNTATAETLVTADVAVGKNVSRSIAAPGQELVYSIGVVNGSPGAVPVTLVDILPDGVTFLALEAPAGWTCSTPTVGQTGAITCEHPALDGGASFSLRVRIGSVSTGTILTNTAEVSTPGDSDLSNNTDTASTRVERADLSVTKTGPAVVALGATIAYQVVVRNDGTLRALDVSLTDELPDGTQVLAYQAPASWSCSSLNQAQILGELTCTIAVMEPGAVAVFSVQLRASLAQGATYINVARVETTTPEGGIANNLATVQTFVPLQPGVPPPPASSPTATPTTTPAEPTATGTPEPTETTPPTGTAEPTGTPTAAETEEPAGTAQPAGTPTASHTPMETPDSGVGSGGASPSATATPVRTAPLPPDTGSGEAGATGSAAWLALGLGVFLAGGGAVLLSQRRRRDA